MTLGTIGHLGTQGTRRSKERAQGGRLRTQMGRCSTDWGLDPIGHGTKSSNCQTKFWSQ